MTYEMKLEYFPPPWPFRGKKQNNIILPDACSCWEWSALLCAACTGRSFLTQKLQETESLPLRPEIITLSWFSQVLCWNGLCLLCWVVCLA